MQLQGGAWRAFGWVRSDVAFVRGGVWVGLGLLRVDLGWFSVGLGSFAGECLGAGWWLFI